MAKHDYWRGAAEDEAMQEEHGFIWRAMLDTIDVDLRGTRVLDVGCNRGGFLRLLADKAHIAEGFGYDRAAGAVADAVRLCGDRPLTFAVADTVTVTLSGPTYEAVRDASGIRTDVTVLNSDGSRTETVSDLNATSSLKDKWVITTSASGLSALR